MGATSEEFINLREKEYLISATFKVEGHLVNTVENYLLETSKLVNYKILPDTDDLYKTDKVFKKLVKIEAEAKRQKEIYTNHKL
tara:strand:+ start:54 stop:305 length:252 start_codon:yes stop_codon:yes gene_type:complete